MDNRFLTGFEENKMGNLNSVQLKNEIARITNQYLYKEDTEPEDGYIEKDIDELFAEASDERYNKAKAKIIEKISEYSPEYLLQCIYDQEKLADYNKLEAELKIILGDMRLKNYRIMKGEG